MTEYCAAIGMHSTVWGDKLLYGHACSRPFPLVGNGVWPRETVAETQLGATGAIVVPKVFKKQGRVPRWPEML